MDICGHIITDEEIIGIGPLMMESPTDPIQMNIYNRRKLTFELHLKNHSTKIESEWYDLYNGASITQQILDIRKRYSEFKEQYEKVREKILAICHH